MANTTNFGSRPASQTVITSPSIGLTGNTLGATTISGNDIYFSGGNNMTLSVNGSTIVFSAGSGGGAGVSQLNGSQGTLSLAVASSLSASTNGSSSARSRLPPTCRPHARTWPTRKAPRSRCWKPTSPSASVPKKGWPK